MVSIDPYVNATTRHAHLILPPTTPLERSHSSHSTLLRNSLSAERSDLSLDLATVLGTMQAIGKDLELEQVIARVLAAAIENAGADRGALLLERNEELALVAESREHVVVQFMDEPVPLREARERLPTAVVRYVVRAGSAVVWFRKVGDGGWL